MTKKYTAKELEKLPTIEEGQTDDLKILIPLKTKIWLSRMTVEDGMPYNNQMIDKKYFPKSGSWKTVREYRG